MLQESGNCELPDRISETDRGVQDPVANCGPDYVRHARGLVQADLGDLRRTRSAETPVSGLSHLIWSAMAILSAVFFRPGADLLVRLWSVKGC